MTTHVYQDETKPAEQAISSAAAEMQTPKEFPTFQVQMRGFNRAQVTGYIQRIHGEIGSLQDYVHKLRREVSDAQTEHGRLTAEIAALGGDIERLSGPIESVEGMSDRIARMMRVASEGGAPRQGDGPGRGRGADP
ncbi:hypothetical protein [Mycobacterium genavense]|uniref:hypothetical protein n=1 Tax=Mycobacterium genavense TaxID=36812 RepID=UPI0004B80F63|nr:hypothetical protein [Mycobacterium genavense]